MNKPVSQLIHELVHLMDKEAEKILAPYEISFSRFHMLAVLKGIQPTTQRYLASCFGYTDAGVSRAVTSLAEQGFVYIRVDPHNPRRNQVSLTAAGKKMLKRCGTILEKEFVSIVRKTGSDPKQLGQAIEAINKELINKESD